MKSHGFTIIEAVVTISIIAIISSFGYVWWRSQDASPSSTSTSQHSSASNQAPSLFDQYPQVESSVLSPNGKYKLSIRSKGQNEQLVRAAIVSTVTNSHPVLVLRHTLINDKDQFDSTEWLIPTSANWSKDSKYIFLETVPPEGGDIYLFKADGSNFNNSKPYLDISELGYNGQPIISTTWSDNTALTLIQGSAGPIAPTSTPTWIISVINEKIIKQ